MFENVSFLYVEDDARSRQVMELILTKVMQVKNLVIFADSTDFMTRLQTVTPPPDVVLLDIQVLPHDGFAMLDMIRADAQAKNAKIIALTASVMNEEVEAMRSKGFDGAISKPLSVLLFPELMEQVIAGKPVWHIT